MPGEFATSDLHRSPELAAAVDAAPVGLVAVDDAGLIVEVNSRLERLLGYSRAELAGRPVETLIPDTSRAGHVRLRQGFAAAPAARPMGAGRELFAQHADGRRIPVEIALEPLRTSQGSLVLAVVVDITERRIAETAFRVFFDASPYGQLLVDRSGRIVLGNRALRDILGHPPEALSGQPLSMLLPERHRAAHGGLLAGYFADPQVRMMGTGRDLTARHADGTEVAVEVGLSVLPWGDEQHAVATVVDITGRRRLELQLRRANSSLEEFLYVASHDLRSPLRGIRDLLEWIGEDLGDDVSPDVRRNLQRIEVRVDRMQNLMDALLAYTRSWGNAPDHVTGDPDEVASEGAVESEGASASKAGRTGESRRRAGDVAAALTGTPTAGTPTAGAAGSPPELVPVDVADVVAGILELDPLPAGFEVDLDVRVEPFPAARTPLEVVLRNLIGNAVKHHDRDRGQIRVTATADGSFCLLDVADDGPGVPPAAHDRIFRLFQTLSDDDPHRSGIGLALVKRLVGTHGGRIEVLSAPDTRGTTFRVWWPRFPRRGLHES
ncbi:MAG TPA: PAS domain-containing sensor histidine kinase [Kineosporiaceae bacterium]|nr:PAS domain-containing sensor histidine kinase [Kineosporiaceae bacterium]